MDTHFIHSLFKRIYYELDFLTNNLFYDLLDHVVAIWIFYTVGNLWLNLIDKIILLSWS
jgi:hypothetical protein